MKDFLTDENLVTKAGKIVIDKSILNLSFEDIKKDYKDKLDKCLERWGELGFIEGLSGETRERTAFAMEQLAIYLIYEALENDSINNFETIGFPMIRRIIAGSIGNFESLKDPKLFDFNLFIKYCRELDIRKMEEKLTELSKPVSNIDAEAEACAIASEIIISKFNGDEKSFDELAEKYLTIIKNKE